MAYFRHVASAMLFASISHPALAQSERESVTIDALATIDAPAPVLSISSSSNLSFGKVSLPGTGIGYCRYRIGPLGEMSSVTDGQPSSGTTCAFQDSGQAAGRVAIQCQAGETVSFSYEISSPLQNQQIGFQITSADIGFREAEPAAPSSLCSGGSALLDVGGELTISSGAVAQDNAVVGRVTLDVFYGSPQCNCD